MMRSRRAGSDRSSDMPQFVKRIPAGRPGMSRLEAAGLQWLERVWRDRAAGGVVRQAPWCWSGSMVAAMKVPPAFGAQLARVHRRPAPPSGSPPPGTGARSSWVGSCRCRSANVVLPQHYVGDRLRPAAATAITSGGLTNAQDDAIRGLCDLLLSDPKRSPGLRPRPHRSTVTCGQAASAMAAHRRCPGRSRRRSQDTPDRSGDVHLFGLPTWPRSSRATNPFALWPRDGGDGSPCIRSSPYWCTPPCSGTHGAAAAEAATQGHLDHRDDRSTLPTTPASD